MTSTYLYRLLKSSWGIRVSITASAEPMAELTSHAATQGRIYVRFGDSADSLTDDLKREIENGLSIIEEEIISAVRAPGVLVTVEDVSFNEADFQAEGLAVAVIRWAEQELGLSRREIVESFDRAANRYSFTFP